MGFLRTNDLSEVKNGEFSLDFNVFLVKTGELVICRLKIKSVKKNCKIEFLAVLGH